MRLWNPTGVTRAESHSVTRSMFQVLPKSAFADGSFRSGIHISRIRSVPYHGQGGFPRRKHGGV